MTQLEDQIQTANLSRKWHPRLGLENHVFPFTIEIEGLKYTVKNYEELHFLISRQCNFPE